MLCRLIFAQVVSVLIYAIRQVLQPLYLTTPAALILEAPLLETATITEKITAVDSLTVAALKLSAELSGVNVAVVLEKLSQLDLKIDDVDNELKLGIAKFVPIET